MPQPNSADLEALPEIARFQKAAFTAASELAKTGALQPGCQWDTDDQSDNRCATPHGCLAYEPGLCQRSRCERDIVGAGMAMAECLTGQVPPVIPPSARVMIYPGFRPPARPDARGPDN